MGLSLPDERWVPIKGHEDKYHVSNRGRVKSLPCIIGAGVGKRKRGSLILKPQRGKQRKFFCVYRNSVKYTLNLETLMAEHWPSIEISF